MLWMLVGLLMFLVVGVGMAVWKLDELTSRHEVQIRQQTETQECLQEQLRLLEEIGAELTRVTGYVRYLRARAWQDDPTFIEDVNEGDSTFAPEWHELKRAYGLWVRDSDEHEGATRVMRGETTKTEQYLRDVVRDANERLSTIQQREMPDEREEE